MDEETTRRRRILVIGTGAAGLLAGLGASVPLISSMAPSAKARAAGAPVRLS